MPCPSFFFFAPTKLFRQIFRQQKQRSRRTRLSFPQQKKAPAANPPGRFHSTSTNEPYLSRKITSPCPTICSFSHNRYLNDPALTPTRGGPLSNRIPAGA